MSMYQPLDFRAENTTLGYANAITACNAFVVLANTGGHNFKKVMDLTVADLDTAAKMTAFQHFIGCYCAWLVTHKHDGEHFYACGTQVQYLSGVMSKLSKMHPNINAIRIGPPPHPDFL
jgi:hypothetical protein